MTVLVLAGVWAAPLRLAQSLPLENEPGCVIQPDLAQMLLLGWRGVLCCAMGIATAVPTGDPDPAVLLHGWVTPGHTSPQTCPQNHRVVLPSAALSSCPCISMGGKWDKNSTKGEPPRGAPHEINQDCPCSKTSQQGLLGQRGFSSQIITCRASFLLSPKPTNSWGKTEKSRASKVAAERSHPG